MPETTFLLTSPAFTDGDAIPRRHTCDGEDVSPPLAWSGVPAGAGALVLVVDDPDASGFVHWVAYDLPPDATGLAEGDSTAPGAPAQARNDFGRVGWSGPCPPSGTHRYRFRLIAVDGPLGLGGTPAGRAVAAAAADRAIGETTLTGTYARQ